MAASLRRLLLHPDSIHHQTSVRDLSRLLSIPWLWAGSQQRSTGSLSSATGGELGNDLGRVSPSAALGSGGPEGYQLLSGWPSQHQVGQSVGRFTSTESSSTTCATLRPSCRARPGWTAGAQPHRLRQRRRKRTRRRSWQTTRS